MMCEDRTKCHADHVDNGIERRTCAAVGMFWDKSKDLGLPYLNLFSCLILLPYPGILKAVHCGQPYELNRITKDVVAFHAADFYTLVEKLQLDLHEPPISQV